MKILIRALVGMLVLVLGVAGAGTALYWQSDRTVAQLAPKWAPAPSTFVSLMGMQVHVRDQGPRDDPEPIILLHGTSASLHTWEGWIRELKQQHRVITLDLPGFGLTGPFPDNDYHLPHYVAFMSAVLDHFGIQRCVLGGNSFGGRVAWETALAEPLRVQRLILVDAAGYRYKSASMPIGFRLAQIPVLGAVIDHILPRPMVEASLHDVYGDPAKVTPALVDRYFELTLRAGNRHALVERFRQNEEGRDQDRIASLKQPTLILWGEKDHLIPEASAERFHQDIQSSELVIMPGLGHVPHDEDPVATVKVVETFLARTQAAAG